MTHLTPLGIVASAFVAASPFGGPPAGGAPRVVGQPVVASRSGPEALLSITTTRIESRALHAAREVSVWVPDGDGAPGSRLAVLVLLDAQDRNQFRSALANIRYLIDRHVVPPLMVIGVPFGASRDHDLTPPARGALPPMMQAYGESAGGADRTAQFIIDEVLPWADAHYPTLPVRLLAGHSYGGLFALWVAAAHPETFRVVIAMSPSLGWDGGTASKQIFDRLTVPTTRPRSIFVSSGGLEANIDKPTTAFATQLMGVVDQHRAGSLSFTHRRYEHDSHSMTPLPSLVDALRWAYAPLAVPGDSVLRSLFAGPPKDSAAVWGAVRSLEARFRSNATSLGVPDAPFPEDALNLVGYYCSQTKLLTLANRFFAENSRRYPKSSNAHESLAEGLLAVGDTTGAVAAFRRALAVSTRDDDINRIASHAMLHQLHQD